MPSGDQACTQKLRLSLTTSPVTLLRVAASAANDGFSRPRLAYTTHTRAHTYMTRCGSQRWPIPHMHAGILTRPGVGMS